MFNCEDINKIENISLKKLLQLRCNRIDDNFKIVKEENNKFFIICFILLLLFLIFFIKSQFFKKEKIQDD